MRFGWDSNGWKIKGIELDYVASFWIKSLTPTKLKSRVEVILENNVMHNNVKFWTIPYKFCLSLLRWNVYEIQSVFLILIFTSYFIELHGTFSCLFKILTFLKNFIEAFNLTLLIVIKEFFFWWNSRVMNFFLVIIKDLLWWKKWRQWL